ncbi:hypothetical protein [Priestia megaterium]|uniref:hypothetical protein n=1 Tax=Priestia megaterium TaxID=1404 RepID=UPI000BF40DF0|nr:hypothetical protein [Priestia megaterium]PFJ00314.1 hypothetical protein COI84_08895 [Priestia megaterium]PGR16732.1 hypothetical protein COC62_00165 [Priestia megaterium]
MEKDNKFPTKKDMTYWIIILILFIVGSFTFYYGSNKSMVSHIGFGGTIVSILLAVIAIIYSFYQSSTYESTTYKLDTSAQKIEEATTQLSDVSEIKVVLESFKDEVKEINESIIDLKEISNTIGNGVDSMKESFEDTRKTIYESVTPNSQGYAVVEEREFSIEFFKKTLEGGGNLPLFTLMLCNQAFENDIKKVNLAKWNKRYITRNNVEYAAEAYRELANGFRNVQLGFLSAFSGAGFLDVQFVKEGFIQINHINGNLSKAIVNTVASLSNEKIEDKSLYDFFMNTKDKLLEEEQ